MFGLVRGKWKDLRIQSKFFITYLLLAVIPLSGFGVAAYIIAVNTLEQKANNSYRVITSQINYNVDAVLRGIDRMTILPFIDQRIYSAMTKLKLTTDTYTEEDFQTEKEIEKEMRTYFTSLQVLHEGIIAVYMIMDNDQVYGYTQYSNIISHNTLKEQAWFQETILRDGGFVNSGLRLETQFYRSNEKKTISLARHVKQVDTNESLGVFVVDIDPYIFNFSAQQPRDGYVVIADQYGNIIHSSLPIDKESMTELMDAGKVIGPNMRSIQWGARSEKMVGVASTSEYSGWMTLYLTSKKALYQDLSHISNLAIGIIVVILLFSVILAGFVARGVASPIKRLSRLMKKVQNGDFHIFSTMKQKDEIGLLSDSFNSMVIELTQLVERIKSEEESKRKAEIDALRAQINPHFIYNTLSAIKMMAMMQNANDIAKVLEIFIHLMKYCTRSDRKWVVLQDEIEFIKDYVALLERRYMKQFAITYTSDAGAERVWVIPFLIQPIVENAIFHGLDSGNSNHKIEILMRRGDACDLFIEVRDYGTGMSEEKVKSLLNANDEYKKGLSGTGLKNIHERIALEFGKPYGLTIKSVIGEGTIVTIRVPWKPE
ncbi:cache domain-containing sensor histidine kinase [Cohnella abietis]|uniref:Histidine kinase n=1 Tax=Cohnella abietis TaxID=2507935 RepID=A0A3T1DCR9_9BACL|nr:sensor histidine kinase [Cohnella abietis]BBI35735.1 histidine kinase [Cohnella abietis]